MTQVCDATQSIDISTKDYCARCYRECFQECLGDYSMGCSDDCESKKCPCCHHKPPSCWKWLKLWRHATIINYHLYVMLDFA